MIKLNIYTSLLTSILVQVITGIIEILSLFINVSSKYLFLKQMMLLEIFVQIIEGSFYVYWLFHYRKITNITPKRYLDWMITTPTMLVNLIFYLIYLQNINIKLNFFTLFKKEFYTIILILILNWLMLLFGYLAEISIIPVSLGITLGFIPFIIYYYIIYDKYAILSHEGLKIYMYFFIFWSLYGLAAFLPYKIKNMSYNILDLFSKNFFGLFLTYLLFSGRAKSTNSS